MLTHAASPNVLRGYLILKLKRHCEHLAELTPAEAAALGPMIRETCLALTRVLQPARIHVASWGESVKHIHFHIIPRGTHMLPGNWLVLSQLRWWRLLSELRLRQWVSEAAVIAAVAQLRQGIFNQPSINNPQ